VRTRNATLAVAGALLAVAPVSLVVLGGASFSEGVTVPVRVPSSAAVVDDAGSTVPAHPRARHPRHPAPPHRRHHDRVGHPSRPQHLLRSPHPEHGARAHKLERPEHVERHRHGGRDDHS